jgi:hypothetical protein
MSERKPRPKAPQDIAILSGPTEDGQGARVVRIREGNLSAGEIRPVKEGEPITHNEIVRLRPLDAERRVCEVEVIHAPAALPKEAAVSGPARVSTPNYRKNWSTIFATKRKRRSKSDWSMN